MGISEVLKKAREYEAREAAKVPPEERPAFHLTPYVGWMNDPNGFSFYKGQYHLFYQYHPYSTDWGPMHWGHAVSRDLLHWEYLPAAIAPDEGFDNEGCFSGCAETLPDGRQLLMYTGVTKEKSTDGHELVHQRQCLAIGDGLNYEKYDDNPVLTETDLPEGSDLHDFRDPKIFHVPDGTYRCITGNCTGDAKRDGRILLFSSEDAWHWKFEKVLIENKGRFGKMWECPDFFPLDGKWVLITSPQDMEASGHEFHCGDGTVAIIGDFDWKTNTFIEESFQSIDQGIDYYAPQTIQTGDGKRIAIAWMQNWDTVGGSHEPGRHIFGQMSLPREWFLKGGRLCQKPVKALGILRQNKVVFRDIHLNGKTELEGIRGRQVDLTVMIRPENKSVDERYKNLSISFAADDAHYTSVSFSPDTSMVRLDRSHSGSRRAIVHQMEALAEERSESITLRIILDRYSAEVFVNEGEHVLTATFNTPLNADRIIFRSDGAVKMDVEKYDLIP